MEFGSLTPVLRDVGAIEADIKVQRTVRRWARSESGGRYSAPPDLHFQPPTRAPCGARLALDLKDRLDFDGYAGGQLGEAEGAAGVVAIALLTEDFVEEIGAAIDDEVLVGVLERRVHAAEDLDYPQAVEGAMGVPDGVQDFLRTVPRRRVAGLGCDPGAELPLQITDMTGGDELVTAANAQLQVTGRLLRERETEGLCFFLGVHGCLGVMIKAGVFGNENRRAGGARRRLETADGGRKRKNGDGRPDTVGGRWFDGRVKGAMQLNASVMGVSR